MAKLHRTITIPQKEFMDLHCKYPLFVGGYGSGKSEIMCTQAVSAAMHSGNSLIACYEPVYDLVKLILKPRLIEKLNELGIRYKYNTSDHIFYSMSSACGDIILRSMDNPDRIIGYESYRSFVDEIDTLATHKAKAVWDKMVGRNRQKPDGVPKKYMRKNKKGIYEPYNKVSAFSTPEGFKFAYDRWVKNASPNYQMVQASTLSNPFLPDDYVDGLTETYGDTPALRAYVNGDFVNLASGQIYYGFNRVDSHSNATHLAGEAIHVGMDFNVRNMNAIVFVKRDGISYAVDEVVEALDTDQMCAILKVRYPNETIIVYPDATGKNATSKGASTSDFSIIRGHGIRIKAQTKNPFVKDRIISSNVAFNKKKVWVNTEKCPSFTMALEQQIYDKNSQPQKSLKDSIDDLNDAGTYFIYSTYPLARNIPIAY